ncbi:MAG: NAD(+)/NADH kinase [Spirochaetaceae bacterium]|nr:NAD(+)/NADH kinase [Spirochaetaceae bacterium]
MQAQGTLGLIVNPHSGRDTRRLFARAGTSTIEDKRNQVTRIVVGAAAAGVRRILLSRDAFRITAQATDGLALDVGIEILEGPLTGRGRDSQTAALAMHEAGCGAIVALGGDGTSRAIAQVWPDVALLPLSTGTNNVFPFHVEATIAGAAAGLVASGRLARDRAGRRAKRVRVRCEDGRESIALIDAALLVDDHPGSLLQADPQKLSRILLARAEPASVGLSPVGGLLLPCGAEDDFGVEVRTRPEPRPETSGKSLRAPISPGLYQTVGIDAVERIELGASVVWTGPGLLAFDGDREIVLAPGERATLEVVREGPFVIEPERALRAAAEQGLFVDLGHWHDQRTGSGTSCC